MMIEGPLSMQLNNILGLDWATRAWAQLAFEKEVSELAGTYVKGSASLFATDYRTLVKEYEPVAKPQEKWDKEGVFLEAPNEAPNGTPNEALLKTWIHGNHVKAPDWAALLEEYRMS
jgi:hypothetical protein